MITKRNYFTILLMFAVLFFMFMFLQMMKEIGNEYDVNPYAKDSVLVSGSVVTVQEDSEKEQVYFFHDLESSYENVIEQWCRYTKRELHMTMELKEYDSSGNIYIVDPEALSPERDVPVLLHIAKAGNIVIFCRIPAIDEIRTNAGLRELLGIDSISSDSVQTDGIKLFSGFLLGGESIYRAVGDEEQERQDLELTMPWFLLNSNCKTYMVGLMEDTSIENEELPAVLWRCSLGDGLVFAVNGNYMEECMGIGMLQAMMAESKSYELYPVVNAQSLGVANFPGFANENNDLMMSLYSRNQISLFRDIIWPSLCSIAMKSNAKLTCYMTSQHNFIDKDEPDSDTLIFFLKQMREQNSEAAVSLDASRAINLTQKLTGDEKFFVGSGSKYSYRAGYMPADQLKQFPLSERMSYTSKLQTVSSDVDYREEVLSYLEDDVTVQMITDNGIRHTFRDDLRLRALETALAYSNTVMDMGRISWPEEDTDRWEILAEKFSSNTYTYGRPFAAFEQTTASESDRRIRSLLAVNYYHEREKDTVYLHVEAADEPWFMFRIHGEKISSVTGADYKEVEEGAYLIHATESEIEISLKDSDQLYYTLE